MSRDTAWNELLSTLLLTIVEPSTGERAPRDPVAVIADSLAAARLDKFLQDAAAASGPLTIVVNDSHRNTDSHSAISAVMTTADRLRLECRWRLLVACGSHRFPEMQRGPHEQRVVGSFRERFEEIAWHDDSLSEDHGKLGPYRLNRRVVDNGFTIAIGSCEPHYFAGITGAHKTLTVGLMSADDLRANHEHALSEGAAPLALEGNPVYDAITRVLDLLEGGGRRIFAVNEVLIRGRVVACFAGSPTKSLRAALPTVNACLSHAVPGRFDLVVACVEPPLDRSLYQADKGIKNVEAVVRDGGFLILDAPCREGVGYDRFLEVLRRAPDHPSSVAIIREEGYRLGDHKAVRLRSLTDRRRVRVGIVSSGLPKEIALDLHVSLFERRNDAAHWVLGALGALAVDGSHARSRALVVGDAGNMALRITAPA